MAFINQHSFLYPSASSFSCTKCTCSRLIALKHVVSKRRVSFYMSDDPKPNQDPPNPSSADDEQSSLPDDDKQISDLSLPNLRELFQPAGDSNCEQCKGKGEISCPVCEAKGFISLKMMDTVSTATCRMCQGQTIIPCPSCRKVVYKSVLWWDQIPSKEDDPDEKWREDPDGQPRIPWGDNPTNS